MVQPIALLPATRFIPLDTAVGKAQMPTPTADPCDPALFINSPMLLVGKTLDQACIVLITASLQPAKPTDLPIRYPGLRRNRDLARFVRAYRD